MPKVGQGQLAAGAPPVSHVKTRTGVVTGATALRLVLTPVVVWLVLSHNDLPAAVAFAVAAATDYLDGYLARRWRVSTTAGSFLDTTADKVLVTGALLALVAIDRTSTWAALVIIGRELTIMGLRGSAALSGVLISPSPLGRLKTAVQFVAILLSVLGTAQPLGPMGLDQWAMLLAVVITLASAADYLIRYSRVAVTGTKAG